MEKQEWLDRCAAQLKKRGGLDDVSAAEVAEGCLELWDGDLTQNPEDVADEEMSCWGG